MAHIMADRDLYAWCEHGTPLGHSCPWCRTKPAAPERPAQTGWECPRCHRVWNPSVLACHHCARKLSGLRHGSKRAPCCTEGQIEGALRDAFAEGILTWNDPCGTWSWSNAAGYLADHARAAPKAAP